jgi:iron(III) transport system substrate-binding protein
MTVRTWLFGLVIGMVAATPQAQTIDFGKVVAAAKKEGRLVMYGAPADTNLQQVAQAFQKAYGITVEFTRIPSGPLTQRVDAELKTGRPAADVVAVNELPWAKATARAGHVMKLEGIPASANYPKQYWDPYTPGMAVVVPVLMFNTKLVPADAVPKTWNDLLDPRWKGKIGMTTANAGLGAISIYRAVAEKLGEDYFRKLAANQVQIVASTSAASSLVASGEMALLLPAYGYVTRPVKEKGAPVDEVHLDITPIYTRTVFALEKAPNRNAALVFVNWTLTEEGQLAWNGNYFASSTLPGVPTTLPVPPQATIVDQEAASAEAAKVVEMFNRHMGR